MDRGLRKDSLPKVENTGLFVAFGVRGGLGWDVFEVEKLQIQEVRLVPGGRMRSRVFAEAFVSEFRTWVVVQQRMTVVHTVVSGGRNEPAGNSASNFSSRN